MIFGQNLISILMSKPDKQAIMQMSFFGADPLPKTPDHQKKFVAHQNSNFFILSYALTSIYPSILPLPAAGTARCQVNDGSHEGL